MNEVPRCKYCDHDIDDHHYGKICQSCLWDDKADTCTESPSSIAQEYTSRILNNAPPTTSDGYHSFEELYEYRMLYNAMAANLMPHISSKSWRHSDGEYCFGGGWFVVTMNLPVGQVTNHYQEQYWDLFQIQHLELAPPWDGHTPKQAADRLKSQCLNITAIEPNPCALVRY